MKGPRGRKRVRVRLLSIGAALVSVLLGVARGQELQHRPAEQNPRVVACRIREAHASRSPAAGLVIFSQKDKVDSQRLSGLLRRAQDGGAVEFQSNEGGDWTAGSIVRLKSCFGRGLMILPTGRPLPAEGSTILVRFPVETLKPE